MCHYPSYDIIESYEHNHVQAHAHICLHIILYTCVYVDIRDQGHTGNLLWFLSTIHPINLPLLGLLVLSFSDMSGGIGAARGGDVEAMPISEINGGFDASMLKVMDTNRVGDKVRQYLFDLGATTLSDASVLCHQHPVLG